jgi:hypothetical protein
MNVRAREVMHCLGAIGYTEGRKQERTTLPMIEERQHVFYITTAHTSYWFRVTAHGQLEHLYYGPRLTPQDPIAVAFKHTSGLG